MFKLLFRYRIDGRENLRAFKGVSGVLLVANHTSFLDVVFMYLACRPSQWGALHGTRHPLRQRGRFDRAGALARGGVPVKRDSADRTSIKRAARMLKDKEVVGILPEGTRRARDEDARSTRARRSWRAWGMRPSFR